MYRFNSSKVVLDGAAVAATHQLAADEFVITPISTSSGDGGSANRTCTVTVDTNGGNKMSNQTVTKNLQSRSRKHRLKRGLNL